ncbi:MAG TPA: TIGR02449 family protein [Chromatiales bacterium]|nr:TIGR02449 family protein [Chromatiales bacterium]
MDAERTAQVAELELKRLEARVDELVRLCRRLKEENQALRARERQLLAERARLLEKHEEARTRVEAIITHLKAMEQGS